MNLSVKYLFILTSLPLILLTSCNRANDQRDFEREAFSLPEGITETDGRGEILNSDPDDWRIAPFFQGLVEVDPAYPNPVQSTGQISIDVIVTGVESVSGLIAYVFYEDNNIRNVYYDDRRPLPPGPATIRLSALDVARFREDPQGTYRIIILDANENIITYGDVRVE